ncbi:MAG: glycosyltransferase family 9 protein [Bacteroidales bacterium]|jgi:ADP-heptose:LPS heptosyltransferase|nr:glycosyltransferase family 9 protein [Bacteroidales bacterium]
MKILIIRFSSIGDIVLTTPIVRCIAKQIPDAEIHFICKPGYKNILEKNPYIRQLHVFDTDNRLPAETLKAEKFDYIIDLQNNFRSKRLAQKLGVPYAAFPKLNIKKWLLVNLNIHLLPEKHVVDRYFEATEILPAVVENDFLGLDFFMDDLDRKKIASLHLASPFVAVAMGSQHATKQLPLPKLINICNQLKHSIVLLGGKEDKESGDMLCAAVDKDVKNLCGELSLRESAACIEQAKVLLTGDTGLMHIGSALHQNIVSVWGNTVPEFGMYPYMPQNKEKYVIIENKQLSCRPCSKLGHKKCPKKHFKCMNDIDDRQIITLLNE